MKGGGLTWVGWIAIGVGSMLVYAGMTGQSLVTELGSVLRGGPLTGGATTAPSSTAPGAATVVPAVAPAPDPDAAGKAAAASRAIPWPAV